MMCWNFIAIQGGNALALFDKWMRSAELYTKSKSPDGGGTGTWPEMVNFNITEEKMLQVTKG